MGGWKAKPPRKMRFLIEVFLETVDNLPRKENRMGNVGRENRTGNAKCQK